MKGGVGILVVLAAHFAGLSLLTFGGANAVVPEMHRKAVEVAHWMTDQQFADMFAIAQTAPGPNVLVVTLIGYHIAGLAGALVATLAMCGPTCVMTYFVSRLWDRFKATRWRAAIQAGLVPISIGLIGGAAVVLVRAADRNAVDIVLTVATAAIAYATRINPLWMFALAGLAGLAGFA